MSAVSLHNTVPHYCKNIWNIVLSATKAIKQSTTRTNNAEPNYGYKIET